MNKDHIIKVLQDITGFKEINLEFPENEVFGDYSTNIAMILAKKEGKNPKEVAEDIINKLKKNEKLSDIVEKIETAGAGFINFWLKKDVLLNNLIEIDRLKEKYGSSQLGSGKTVIVDYSSPNIAKPFGIGHLRSTTIGQALYNLYKFLGYEVVGDNHLGDWGTQFGKLLYMIDIKKVSDFDIAKLENLYVEFHKLAEDPEKAGKMESSAREWFKKLEGGDSKAKSIWKKCVDVSLEEFDKIYDILGVKIDFAFGESYYQAEMKDLLNNPSIIKHISEGDDGAKIIDLTSEGIETPLMLLKKDEGTTYATRDLATIAFRQRKWNPDIIIYEVGAEQTFYFRQIFAAARLLGLIKKDVDLVHTAHGLYLSPQGKKFATREGKTIKLEEVLDEAILRAKKLGNKDSKTAEMVGVGAIKYFDLKHTVSSDVAFDWDKMMNLEGNSGPYIQYTVVRANSVIEKSGKEKEAKTDNLNEEEKIILRLLCRFNELIATSAKNYSPNILCGYLYNLAQKYNAFYNKHKIIGSKNESFRLLLSSGVIQVLKTGLNLLGISVPERM